MEYTLTMNTLQLDTLQLDTLRPVLKPVETARGLPNEFYTDVTVHEQEKQSVFFKNWAALGFVSDVSTSHNVKPVSFLGQPLVMVRDHSGEVRIFENICRHRGMILVAEPSQLDGAIRCPYHSWCYSLKGELKAMPHVGGPGENKHPDMKVDTLGLNEVRSAIWMGIVFVNVSGDAPEFETYAENLIQRWSEFDQPLHWGGEDSRFTLDVDCNWKLPVENYCESYHLPWIHPGLNSYSRLEDHYNIEQPGSFSGQGSTAYTLNREHEGIFLPNFKNLTEKWNEQAEYVALYPNVLLGVMRDHFYAMILEPVNAHKTREHFAMAYSESNVLNKKFNKLRENLKQEWKDIMVEDIFVVEGMQKGRQAQKFDGGKFSPVMDSPTHCFHSWVAQQFLDPLSGAAKVTS